jgi:hypothetical protein
MRALGCLTVIVILVLAAIFWLTQGHNLDQQRAGQWIGQKAHRGWNMLRQTAQGAQKGWDAVPDRKAPGGPGRQDQRP